MTPEWQQVLALLSIIFIELCLKMRNQDILFLEEKYTFLKNVFFFKEKYTF